MACSKSCLPMWERLRRFSGLEPAARRVFLRAAVLLPLLGLSLRLRGFRRTQAALQRFLPSTENAAPARTDRIVLTARMVHAAVRHSFGHPTCLEESLALWWLLGRQGIASQVRIGIRKDTGTFEAHAWVECEGAAVNEPEALHQHYAAFEAEFSALPPEAR
jgi:hypothetical protein